MTAAEQNFIKVAPPYMVLFKRDFKCTSEDAAAVFGNAGYESKGLTDDQEDKPTSGRGGLNWFQWTGPRRVAFEAYCKRNKLDPNSDEAAYKYLFVELTTTEKTAITKLKQAVGLDNKVIAFEAAFERAGVKAYDKRQQWARLALQALNDYEANHGAPADTEGRYTIWDVIVILFNTIKGWFKKS